jgi:signal transduction histidine kinase
LLGNPRFLGGSSLRKERVEWQRFLETTLSFFPFRLETDVGSEPGFFDPAQMQQALINLLKNAAESGSASDEIAVALERGGEQGPWLLQVLDRGKGMDEDTMTAWPIIFAVAPHRTDG